MYGNIASNIPTTATLSLCGNTGTVPAGSIYVSGGFLAFSCNAASPFDFTIRIAATQLERGSTRTPIIYPPVGSPQVSSRGLLAGAGSFTPTGATINGTGGVRAFIAPVAAPTGARIAGGEANVCPLITPAVATPNTCDISTDILPPAPGGSTVFKHVRNGTTGDANCGYIFATGPSVAYTLSVMVWLPAGFAGTAVFLTGTWSTATISANLSLTNQWQKVSVRTFRQTDQYIYSILYINDATATPIYTSLWTYTPDTVVAAPTIFGNTTLGGVGSVTASAYTLAQAGARIDARGSLTVDARNYAPTGAQIDGRGGQTNYIRNPRVEGAVVGTPGTLPTYWLVNITPGILTQQVVATGTDAASGLAWVDLRFFGTTPSASGFTIYIDPIIYNGAPGDMLTNTIWMALSGGSTTNITGLYFTTQYQPGGNGNFGPTIIPGITSTLTPYSANWGYLPVAAPAFNGGYIYVTWAAGPVDITLRIAATQLERGTVATPIIYPPVGAPQASTRALLAMPRVPGLAQATIGGVGSVSATAVALRPAAAPVGGRNGTTNYVLNPRWVGAALGTVAVGPIQSPPMPTGWTCWSDTVTTTIVGIGTEDGLDYIDVRLAGTTTNTLWGLNPIHFDGPTTRGDVWTVSFHLSVQSGDTSQMQWRIETQELDANGVYVTATANNRSVFPTGKLIAARASETYTISNSATRYSLPTFFLTFAAGQAIDITIRLACMQSELGPVATPLILPPPGVMAIATRAVLAMPTTLALPQQIIAGQGGKTNYITNPRAEGAVAGSPGTLPTGWFNSRNPV